MGKHINENTGTWWIDESINRRARKKGQCHIRRRPEGANDYDYDLIDRAGYIEACIEAGRPFVITWVPNTIRLRCRNYRDVFGVTDLFGIEEIPTLFSSRRGMENHRIFLIPYLITGYDIPPELEQDSEPLVPFTAKTVEMVKEIEGEPVWPGWMR